MKSELCTPRWSAVYTLNVMSVKSVQLRSLSSVPINKFSPFSALRARLRRSGHVGPDHIELVEIATKESYKTALLIRSDIPAKKWKVFAHFVCFHVRGRQRRDGLDGQVSQRAKKQGPNESLPEGFPSSPSYVTELKSTVLIVDASKIPFHCRLIIGGRDANVVLELTVG